MTREWVADPGIGWRILLTAYVNEAPDPGVVLGRLSELAARQEWEGTVEVRSDDDVDALRSRLVDGPAPVVGGIAGSALVVSAHHARVDGLGLLDVMTAATGRPMASSARGVGERPTRGGLVRTASRRLAEAAFRPPARVATPEGALGSGDAFAELTVSGSWRTSELVTAAVRGILRHNDAAGRDTRRLAVAVGAGRPRPDDDDRITDRSALIRLTDLEDTTAQQIEERLRSAPLEAPPSGGRPTTARLMAGGMRLLSRRLGSTLLVSHLGEVTAEGVTGLAFHPVTAGGTGLSLGAVGLRGSTTLTLRARADHWDRPGLAGLLSEIAAELG